MLVTLHFFLDTGATQCYTSTLVNTEHCGKEEEGKWRMGANVDYNGAVKAFCNAWIPAQPLRKSIRPTFLCMETLYMNTDGVVWHFFSASGLSDYRAQSFTWTLLNIFFFFFFWTTLFLGPFSVGAGALNGNGWHATFFCLPSTPPCGSVCLGNTLTCHSDVIVKPVD